MKQVNYDNFKNIQLESRALAIKGWLSKNERKFNKWYMREQYSGRGEVIDLGSMFGASLAPMVLGLLENSTIDTGRKVHAFDHFIYP